jgi:hypothetical protein
MSGVGGVYSEHLPSVHSALGLVPNPVKINK